MSNEKIIEKANSAVYYSYAYAITLPHTNYRATPKGNKCIRQYVIRHSD